MARSTQRLRMNKGEADGYYWPLTTDAPVPMRGLPPLRSLTVAVLDPGRWGPLGAPVDPWVSKGIVRQ